MSWPLFWRSLKFFLLITVVSNSYADSATKDETTVFLHTFLSDHEDNENHSWQKPDYSGQSDRLGYEKRAFTTPDSMKVRVGFWKDIYTKFNSNQGLLHDATEIDLIYKKLDLPTEASTGKSKEEVSRLRKKMVDDEKEKIVDMLEKLQARFDKDEGEDGLEGLELTVWQRLKKREGKKEFVKASKKNRLRLQLGQSDHFYKGIYYSGRYLSEIEKVFAENGLPKELSRLPLVESSFNILAESKVGASGIWQFMRSSARRYMKLNRWLDERNDPMKATHAAAKMFRWIYSRTESWPLAITGYNYGPNGIRRLAKKYGTKDLQTLIDKVKSNRFGFASQNFYASFLAALEVEQNADKFFSKPLWAKPLVSTDLTLDRSIFWKDLVEMFDGNANRARLYNPSLTFRVRRGWYEIPKGHKLNIPLKRKDRILASLKTLPKRIRPPKYKVRKGDTLSQIARKFGVKLNSIMKSNRIRHANRIRVGQQIYIPRN